MRGRGTATVEMEFRHRSAGIFRWDTERWSTEGVVGKVGGAEMNISWPWASTYQVDVQWCRPKFQTFSSRLLQMSSCPNLHHPPSRWWFFSAAPPCICHATEPVAAPGWWRATVAAACNALGLSRCGVPHGSDCPVGSWNHMGRRWTGNLLSFLGGDYPVVGKELRSYDSIREVFFPDNQEHRD